MEFLVRHFKVSTLHAILHDDAGAVRAYSGKRFAYCYMFGRGPKSCLLSHVTGLLFCLYVVLFLPSIFNSADFWSSMSFIVLDIGPADIIFFEELGILTFDKVQAYSFRPPKKNKPTKQAAWCTKNLHRNVLNSGRLSYSELPNIIPSDVEDEKFANE